MLWIVLITLSFGLRKVDMNLLIGSRALNYWFDSVKISDDTDWDVISPEPIEGCELHDPNLLNNKDIVD